MTQPSPAQVVHPAGPTLVAMLAVALPMLIAGSVSPTSTFFNQLIAYAGCGLWLLLWARHAAEAPALRIGPAAPWWLGAMVLLALSYLVSEAPIGQRLVPLGCVLLGGALLVASAASSTGGDDAVWAEPLQRALLVGALLSVVVALVQVFAPDIADGVLIAASTTPGRAIGNMRQPNQLSTLLLWGCAAAVWLAVARRWSLGLLAGLLAALVFAVVLTASRTGLVGVVLLAAWGVVDRRLPGRVRLLLIACVGLYAVGWFGVEQWSASTGASFYGNDQVAKTLHGDASSSRGRIWANTLSMIAAQPWRGVGTGAYNYEWSMGVFPDRPVAFFDHSHNLELQLAVESGIPFTVVVLGLMLWALWCGRAALTSGDTRRALGARTALFMLVLVAVHSQLEYPLWYTYFLLPTCLLAGWYAGLAGAEAQAQAAARDEALFASLRHSSAEPAEPAAPGKVATGSGQPGDKAAAAGAPRNRVFAPVATLLGGGALLGSLWALGDYWSVAVVFEPSLAIGDAGSLEGRIARAKRSVLFGHHADYAEVTMAERPEEVLAQFDRPLYHLLDTRLMTAYAKALAGAGHLPEAAHVAARLREFHNPASEEFFEPCETGAHPLPFQCSPDSRLSIAEMRAMQKR
ncbi:MAG: O-antigen ligase C-terminal domain-containing protein [Burkholderiales bacterium]|nr:O-antigen ligase C-terminal domain-containing protein [Burkholderiales bacterium]